MLDVFNLPNSERAPNSDIQIFTGRLETTSNASPPATECFIWKKPRGITMLHILAIGGGAGGGGGQTGAASTARAGGGAGGSGGTSALIIPAIYLPDKLYLFPGLGGIGGTAGVNGVQGTDTYVLPELDPNFGVANVLLRAGGCQTTATAGVGNTGGSGSGTGGAASGTIANCPWAQYGMLSSTFAGNRGGNGGATGNPGVAGGWVSGNNFIMGGGGGGGATTGTNGNGGTQSLASTSTILGPISEANPSASTNGAGGSGGMVLRSPIYPLFVFAGNGGAGDDTTAGGNGGNGIWGSGGGGGGAGTTGGNGGNGGSGVVIITAW